ncbi:MAG TPA: VanZ family protein [Thermoguttaceae bacterium]|nr:VanZ family protein [Thermoguttaceae bacterium]
MSRLLDNATSTRTAWIAVLVYTVVITYLLLAPHPLWLLGASGQDIERTIDRTIAGFVQHVLAYALLACLLAWASRKAYGTPQFSWAVLAIGHGIGTELLQYFIPPRYCDWPDGLANTLGVAFGWLAAVWILRAAGKPGGETIA